MPGTLQIDMGGIIYPAPSTVAVFLIQILPAKMPKFSQIIFAGITCSLAEGIVRHEAGRDVPQSLDQWMETSWSSIQIPLQHHANDLSHFISA